MKAFSEYIKEARKSGVRLTGMKGYGFSCSPADFVIHGAGSDNAKETALQQEIETVEFAPEAVATALNTCGMTYDTWKPDEAHCTDSKIILRTNDKWGNLVTLTISKN